MRNSGKPWSNADLSSLKYLLEQDTPIAEISRTLGRSTSALKHAINKLMLPSMEHDDIFAYYTYESSPQSYNIDFEKNLFDNFCNFAFWMILGSVTTVYMLTIGGRLT